ncbi:hypothetical protein Q7P37_009810 [Cladosporium fusiforme]
MVKRRLKLPAGVEDVPGIECKAFCEKQGYGRSSPTTSTSRKQSPKRKHGDMEERGDGPYDADSAISGMSPVIPSGLKVRESDTGDEGHYSNSDDEQDRFGARRREHQDALEKALISDNPKKRRRSEEGDGEDDRGRTQVRRETLIAHTNRL